MIEKLLLFADSQIAVCLGLSALVAAMGTWQWRQRQLSTTWQESQAKWQSFVQMAGNVLICLSPSCSILEWNPEAEKVYGLRRDEVIGQDYLTLLPETVRDTFLTQCQIVLANKVSRRFEHQVFTPDGEQRLLDWKITSWLDSQGNSIGIIASGEEFVERKRIEERLLLLESVVVSANDTIVITEAEPIDLPGPKIIYVNKAFVEHTGYSTEEIFHKTPRILQGENTDRKKLTEIRTALNNQQSIRLELINYRKDGSQYWVDLSIVPVSNEQGKVTHFVSVQRDITEFKNQQAALVAAREQALKASQTKSQFLAQMSHEIRTPMNGVLGMAELLQRTNLTPQQQDYTRTITSSAKHLLAVINDILDLSKLEAGETRLENIDFDLEACLSSVIDLLASKAEEKDLELVLFIASNLPRQVKGDAVRLRQVLLNLVNNAIKFTEKGCVVIQAALLCQTDQEPEKIYFTVIDTGIGIATEKQSELFQPFSQASSDTNRKYGGTGLGLSICQQFVQLMGGEIGVESTPGQGSTFWFTAEFGFSEESVISKVANNLANMKLLIVDSSALVRNSVRYLAQNLEVEVRDADTASAALTTWQQELAQGTPYDFVLIDLRLLEKDSAKLVRLMHADSVQTRTKVILMSNMKQRQHVEQLLKLGAFGYLLKPITPSRLLNSLLTALQAPEQPTQARASQAERGENLTSDTFISANPSLKILLAEDDLVNQEVILAQLKLLGYQASLATNGQEVLEVIAQQEYDLVLMDCQMPILDGYETTRLIRQREGLQHRTTILALTASALSTDREKCLKAGMDDYVSKPVELEKLGAILRYWANQSEIKNIAGESKTKVIADSAPLAEIANLSPSQVEDNQFNIVMNQESSSPIDLERLNQVFRGKAEAQQKFLGIFIEQAQARIETIRKTLDSEDFDSLRQQAHRLKGSSANAGVNQISELAKELEALARNQNLEGAWELVVKLQECLEQVQIFLQRWKPS
ncbi:MAG: response regulator [Coleofasciculaceae cyanobacterium]